MLQISNLKYSHSIENYLYSLEIEAGTVVAVTGKSGSGKSTLLDLLAGFLEPIEGEIVLDGSDVLQLRVGKRPISILFQNYNLFEHLSVEKNILLGLKNVNSEAKKKVEGILKEVGLEHYVNRLASTLSGGQQQRVALARVLIRESPILLLDEPFTGLDSETKKSMLKLVWEMTVRYNLHTIMVTHDSHDVEAIAQKNYEMQNHTLVEI